MGGTTREYQAIVWLLGSGASTPPHRLTVAAHDEAEARRLLVEQFGDEIRCSIWNQEDADQRWPRPVTGDEVREYKAVVWPKDDPSKPGQRVTLQARGAEAATKMLEEMFLGTEIVYSLWNEEDANRTR